MTYILHIDSSPRGERSISRTLTREFISAWKQIHPGENLSGGAEVRQQSLAAAREAIQQFISSLHEQKFAQQA